MPKLKQLRPKNLCHKTVFIESEIKNFYSYKKFFKEFNQSFQIDHENSYHTVPLYLVWAEKCTFLKKAISKNYFNSKCFYWIDAGYFREKKENMNKYINHWPSPKKCFEDNRLAMLQLRKFSYNFKQQILNFDIEAHNNLNRHYSVAGGMFGGQIKNIMKFINFYYRAIKLFIKRKLFIGKDQTIFTYVSFAHPEIINLIKVNNFKEFKSILY